MRALFFSRTKSDKDDSTRLHERIEQRFLYRGTSTLEIEHVKVAGEVGEITFFARPVFPNDRRATHRARQEIFAEQLFEDTVAIAETALQDTSEIQILLLTALVKRVGDEDDMAIPVLATEITREIAEPILRAKSPRGRSPIDILRRFPTRCRVDRRGNFHEERELQ